MTEDESDRSLPERYKMTPQMYARCKVSLERSSPLRRCRRVGAGVGRVPVGIATETFSRELFAMKTFIVVLGTVFLGAVRGA